MKRNSLRELLRRYERAIFEYVFRDRMPAIMLGVGGGLLGGFWSLTAQWGDKSLSLGANSDSSQESWFILLLGGGLVALATIVWLARIVKNSKALDLDNEARLHKTRETMSAGEQQIEFQKVYRRSPKAQIIEALLAHRFNPVGMCRDFRLGGHLVEWTGTWFVLKNKNHRTRRFIASAVYFACAFLALASLCGGSYFTSIGFIPDHWNELTLGLMCSGLTLMFGGIAGAWLPAMAAHAAAERLVNEDLSASPNG